MIVRRFVVRTDWPGLGFVVVGPGVGAVDASEFLAWLRRHGRGSYTQQTYALGLAHFLTWIDALGVELADVDRRIVGSYITAFREGTDEGLVLGRQPRTVNHRLCVLASFFDFLAGRDRDRGVGVWAARPSPVPRERSPMDGSHGIPGLGKPGDPAWVMLRRGHGRPLSYPAFECALRHLCGKVGVRVTAHMFRHALAQALVDTSGLKVAQEILGHAHVSTTADTYARVDEHAMVSAMERVRDLFDLSARDARSAAPGASLGASDRYVFPYDPATLAELDGIAGEVGA